MDSSWNQLPIELQANILEQLSFIDKVTAQLTCKAWQDLLQFPEEAIGEIWGDITLDLDNLFSKATSSWTARTAKELQRLDFLGIEQLVIPICRPACVELLSNQAFMSKLSGVQFISIFEMMDIRARVPLNALISICSLTDLFQLKLESLDDDGSIEAIPPEISRLTGFQDLDIQSTSRFADMLTAPAELTALQGLTQVTLHGFHNPLPVLSHLPNLEHLSVGFNVGDSTPLSFPLDLGHLTRLSFLELQSLIFDSSFHRLSELPCLQQLDYQRDDTISDSLFIYDQSASGLFAAMHSLRSLQSLSIDAAEVDVDMAVVSALVALTYISLRKMYLPTYITFQGLPQLQMLSLESNNLLSLPSGLRTLTALTGLQVLFQSQSFRLTEPLAFIQCMPALQVLNLRQNMMHPGASVRHTWTPHSKVFLADAETRILPSLPQAVSFDF